MAKALVKIWGAKLKMDFPSMDFVVEYQCDEELGDYGLTFYQNKSGIPDATESHGTPCRATIKENKPNQSPSGPKPGKPEVRKARPDEIPNG